MAIIVKNVDTVTHTYAGQEIAVSGQYSIQAAELFRWQNDDALLADIGSGKAQVNDGLADIVGVSNQINFLKDLDTSPKDSNGAPIMRDKVTESGWHFEPRCISFRTSTYQSLHNRKSVGGGSQPSADIGDAWLRFFNSSSTELIKGEEESAEDFQARLLTDCCRTLLSFEPLYCVGLIKGSVTQKVAPTDPVYIWASVAADIPEVYGGNVHFVNGGFDLSFLGNNGIFQFDGRSEKRLSYDPVYHSVRQRITCAHPVGYQMGLQVIYDKFKA